MTKVNKMENLKREGERKSSNKEKA